MPIYIQSSFANNDDNNTIDNKEKGLSLKSISQSSNKSYQTKN